MVEIETDHLGCPTGRATRLDGSGSAVADRQEAHQAARTTAARKALVFTTDHREVCARAAAILEEACLAGPQVHDAVLIHQVVVDALDEAGVRLRVGVGVDGGREFAGDRIHIVVALRRTVDAVGPVEARVEPLRGVGCRDLRREHEAHLVEEGPRVLFARKVVVLEAPVDPAARHAVEDLARVGLAGRPRLEVETGQRLFVCLHRLQPLRYASLGYPLQRLRNTRLAKVLLRQNVGRGLGPSLRDTHPFRLEDHRAVRVADFARPLGERELGVGVGAGGGEVARELHG